MKKYILSILALAAIAFVGCEKNDIDDVVVSDVKGQVINFGAGALESRTIYESTDSKQIHWQTGDIIRIYCDKAIGGKNNVQTSGDDMAYADYVVTVDATDKSFATIALATTDGNEPLLWGETGVAHKFYAVYPHDAAKDVAADGTVTFPINRNQICYIQTEAEKAADTDASKYKYVARPDMSNAYMVASSEANPADYVSDGTNHDNVWLDFKPIMTTINIVVKGPQNLNTDGTPDVNSTADPVVMTGVSVISTIKTNTTASKSQFVYDIEKAMITGSQAGTGTASEQTETTFISTRNTDGLDALTLQQGETLCLTAFLPPMAETTAQALNRDIKIRVHTTGGNKTMSLEDATALIPSAKGAIKLPSIYTPITGSNWITPLDDDIYVSQLSIPGTHDAATKNCALNSGKCQDLSITEQLKMGIRVFDLRPVGSASWAGLGGDGGDDLNIYHGSVSCDITLQDVFDEFNTFLDENPGEFIITIMRWEEESLQLRGEERFNEDMNKFVATARYTKHALPLDKVKHDITIGEMRGKILNIMRPNQGSDPDGYFATTAPIGMTFISGFPGSHAAGTQQAYCKPRYVNYGTDQWGSRTDWIVYCQNYYEIPNNSTEQENKIEAIKTYLKHAQAQAEKGSNVWVINHCSGYLGTVAVGDVYKALANKVNPEIYKYILQQSTDASGNYKPVGSTGIMLLDFVGSRVSASANVTVYGDLLPQTIIDNNYKYRMKRKGE